MKTPAVSIGNSVAEFKKNITCFAAKKMLAFSKNDAIQHETRNVKARKVATDRNSELEVWTTGHKTRPVQEHSDPLELVEISERLKLKRKFGVSKKAMQSIERAYTQKLPSFVVSSIGEQGFIQSLEEMILHKLRTYFRNTASHFDPFISPTVTTQTENISIWGGSGSGKTFFVQSLFREGGPLEGKRVYYFSPAGPEDRTLQPLIKERKRKKNLTFINLEKFASLPKRLRVEDLDEGSVCVFDDVESLPPAIRARVSQLLNSLLVRGRHKGMRTITIMHAINSGAFSKMVHIETSLSILMHRSMPQAQVRKYLMDRVGMSASEMREVFKDARESRFIAINFQQPVTAITEHSVRIL